MTRKVLILSASIGTGHIKAAEAIQKTLRKTDPFASIRHEDALDFANPAFARIYQQTYNDLVNNAPELMGLIIGGSEKILTPTQHGVAFERWNSLPLVKAVLSDAPDLVICTHPLPADMISWLICKKRLWAHHAIVVTDFELNSLWLCQHYSRYFVAMEEAKQYLMRIGYDQSNIEVSGIPVDPIFRERKDKQAMRAKYGLDAQSRVLLLSAGGLGMGPVLKIVESLRETKNTQLLALCGRNTELAEELEKVKKTEQLSDYFLKIYGYSNVVDEHMTCADLIVGKPGGLTSSEALVKGLVFIIVDPIPGQEEANADHLLEEGAAIRCNNLEILPYKINALLDDSERLKKMQDNARKFSFPFAAEHIANSALGKDGFETWVSRVHPNNHDCQPHPVWLTEKRSRRLS